MTSSVNAYTKALVAASGIPDQEPQLLWDYKGSVDIRIDIGPSTTLTPYSIYQLRPDTLQGDLRAKIENGCIELCFSAPHDEGRPEKGFWGKMRDSAMVKKVIFDLSGGVQSTASHQARQAFSWALVEDPYRRLLRRGPAAGAPSVTFSMLKTTKHGFHHHPLMLRGDTPLEILP